MQMMPAYPCSENTTLCTSDAALLTTKEYSKSFDSEIFRTSVVDASWPCSRGACRPEERPSQGSKLLRISEQKLTTQHC